MFCKHEWEVLSEVTTKSIVEVLIEKGMKEFENIGHREMTRTNIAIVTCKKCGKLKRFVTEI